MNYLGLPFQVLSSLCFFSIRIYYQYVVSLLLFSKNVQYYAQEIALKCEILTGLDLRQVKELSFEAKTAAETTLWD